MGTSYKKQFKKQKKIKIHCTRSEKKPCNKNPEIKAKKLKKDDVGKIPEMMDGETEETCKEHILVMKKEMKKTTNRKMAVIKDLMELTYPYRRKSILLQPSEIDVVLHEYSALTLTSEVSMPVLHYNKAMKLHCLWANGQQRCSLNYLLTVEN